MLQDLQDQLEDLTEQSNEIQEIMGRSYGMPEIDDDELDAELEALGDEIALDDDTSYLDEASKAPNAPTAIPGADSVTNKVIVMIHFILFLSVFFYHICLSFLCLLPLDAFWCHIILHLCICDYHVCFVVLMVCIDIFFTRLKLSVEHLETKMNA